MKRLKRAARNTIVRSAVEVLNMLLSAVFLMYVTRRLGSTDFGKYTLGMSLSGMLVMTADMGIHTMLLKGIASKRDDVPLIFGNILLIKLVLTGLFFALLVAATYLLNYPEDISNIIYAMGIFVVTTSFFDLFNSVFRGYEKMEYEAALMFLNRLTVVASGITVLHMGIGLAGFVATIVISNLVTLLPAMGISLEKFIKPKIRVNIPLIKSIFKGAFPIGLTFLLTTVTLKSGVVLVSLFRGYSDTGMYGAPLRLIESLIVFPVFFSSALFPVFISLYNSRTDSLIKWYEGSIKIIVVLGIPMATLVSVLADEFVLLLFGPEYVKSAVVLRFLIWATIFMSLNTILSHLLIAMDKQRLNAITYSLGALSAVILSLLLIPLFGYFGAGVSLLIGQAFLFASAFYIVYKNLFKISIVHTVLKSFISSLLMAIIMLYMRGLNTILLGLLGVLLYAVFLSLLRVFKREDIVLIREVLRLR